MYPLFAETTLETLEKILDKHGVPIVLLIVIGLALWRILLWAKRWLEPIAKGHIELIEELKKHSPDQTTTLTEVKEEMKKQSRALSESGEEMKKQSVTLNSIDQTTKKTAHATEAISNLTMQNQQTTHQVLDRLGNAIEDVSKAVEHMVENNVEGRVENRRIREEDKKEREK